MVRSFLWAGTLSVALSASACQGPAGEQGPPGQAGEDGQAGEGGQDGNDGQDGPEGPEGPLRDPPRIESMSPRSGSWRNIVTITGENFADEGNEVFFDGTRGTVVSEDASTLVVEPDGVFLDPGEPGRTVDVTVISDQQVSNAHAWRALPSGTPRVMPSSIPAQVTGLATDGELVYASDVLNGIVAVDPDDSFATSTVRPLGAALVKPEALAYHEGHGLLVIDDVSADGDNSKQQLVAVDEASGDTSILVGGTSGLSDAVDVAVDPDNGDIYIARDVGSTNPVWRISDSEGIDAFWGQAALNSRITSIVVVGSSVYVGGKGNDGLFEFEAGDEGGGPVGSLKSVEEEVSPNALARDGAALFSLEGREIKSVANLGSATSTVETYNNFDVPAFNNAIINVSGTLYYSGQTVTPGAVVTFVSPDEDTVAVAAANPTRMQPFSYFVLDGDVYFSSLLTCNGGMPGRMMRVTPEGSMEVAAAEGSCNQSSAATSTGLIVTSDSEADTVSTIDPETGAVTEILDSSRGVNNPISVLVGSGDAVYVVHEVDGSTRIGLTDPEGDEFLPDFADPGSNTPTFGAPLGDQFVFGSPSDGEISALDPETGDVEILVEAATVPGRLMGMTATSEGSVVVSSLDAVSPLDDQDAVLFEILDTGAVWPLHRSSEDDPRFPVGAAALPSGDYFSLDLVSPSGQGGGALLRVTP